MLENHTFDDRNPHPLGWVPLALAAWLVIFGGYELAERTILSGASARLLSVLHLLRGTVTSFGLAGLVAWWMVRRGVAAPLEPVAGRLREVAREAENEEVEARGLWLIRLRWFTIAGVLAAALVAWKPLGVIGGMSALAVMVAAAAMAAYNLIFLSLLRRDRGRLRLILPQIFLDLVALTVSLGFTGGVENPFSIFYLLYAGGAGILLGKRQTYAVTVVACLLFCGMGLWQETHSRLAHPPTPGQDGRPPRVELARGGARATGLDLSGQRWLGLMGTFAAFVTATFSVAYLTTTLVAKLRDRNDLILEAGDQLATEQAKTEELVRSVGAAMVMLDRDNRMVWANPKAHEWFGTDLLGQNCHQRLWDDCKTCSGCSLGAVSPERVCHPSERAVLVDGQRRVFLVQCTPLEGRSEQRLGLIQDITHTKDLQAQVVHSGKMAAIGRLAAGVAHEINNPLAAVASSAELLAERARTGGSSAADSAADLQRHLERIERNVYRCKKIIDSLLAFAHRPAEALEPVELARVMEEVHDLVAASARARSVRLTFTPGPRESEGPAAPDLEAHPGLTLAASRGDAIRQVLVNLLLNAVDATAAGGLVELACARSGEGVQFIVSDDGLGMTPEICSHLFEPFFTTKPVGQGTGLGLYLCHQMVEGLHGRIQFETKPGEGTVFRLWFPDDSLLEEKRALTGAVVPPPGSSVGPARFPRARAGEV